MNRHSRIIWHVFVSAVCAALLSAGALANSFPSDTPAGCMDWWTYLGATGPFNEIDCELQGSVCNGTKGNDLIWGSEEDGAQVINGGFGHDCIIGGVGDHVIHGGFGNDYIDGDEDESGDALLNGGEGYDTLHGGRCADNLINGDECYGGLGYDYIDCAYENQGRESPDMHPKCVQPSN